MKSFLKLLAAGLLALTATDAIAQTRDFAAERFILDDNAGGRLTMSYTGPGDANFIIPPGGATTVPLGSMVGQTLAWDGSQWQAMNNLLNSAGNVSIPTGDLSVALGTISGNGSGLTDLNASELTTGTLALQRISTSGASANMALTFNGVNLDYGNPQAGSLVLPFSQSDAVPSPMFSLESTGLSNVANFMINNAASTVSAVTVSTNGTGYGLTSTHLGTVGAALAAVSLGNAGAAEFATTDNVSTGRTVRISNDGLNDALYSYAGNPGNSKDAVAGVSTGFGDAISGRMTGAGRAGHFEIDNNASTSHALVSVTNGSGAAGHFSVTGSGPGILASSEQGAAARFEITNAANGNNVVDVSNTTALGGGGYFIINNAANPDHAVYGNSNGMAGGSAVFGEHTGAGVGVRGKADNGAGVFGFSGNGIGVSGTSTNSNAGSFEITNAGNTAAALIATTSGTGPAIQINDGGLVGSYGAFNNGQTITSDLVTVLINSDGGVGTPAVNPPASGVNGQIMVVCTDDAHGATITGVGAIPIGGCVTIAYVGGAWRATQ
jgi:hypothetical protein